MSRARSWALFAGVAAATFAVYLRTLYPTVPGGDAGELILAAHLTGSPHPPGYPLFALLAKAFLLVPAASVAWRVNLLAAACGAAASGVLAVAAARWSGKAWAGVAAAGLFALAPGTWEYAVGAEVFSLNDLFAALLLLGALAYAESGEPRWALGTAYLFGLGMANHHTLLFLGIPLGVALVLGEPRRWGRPVPLLRLGVAFALGLLPYLYLPVASLSHAAVTWGDQRTVAGFLEHLLRREYGTLQLGSDQYAADVSFPGQLLLYGRYQLREFLWVGGALAVVGVWSGWRQGRHRWVLAWSVAAWAFYLAVFHALANLPVGEPLFLAIQERFWLMPGVLVAAWAALGLSWLVGRQEGLGWAVALGVIALQLGLHGRTSDRSGGREFLGYGTSLVEALPPDALLLARGDLILNTTQYAQLAEGVRPDVDILDLERLTYPWMARVVEARLPRVRLPGERLVPSVPGRAGVPSAPASFTLGRLVEANAGRRIFVVGNLAPGEAEELGGYQRWPLGLAEELVPAGVAVDVERWAAESEAALPDFPLPGPLHRSPGSWSTVVVRDFWETRHRRGVKMLEVGIAREDAEWLRRAAEVLRGLVDATDEASPLAWRNLGLAYAWLRGVDPGYDALMREAWRRYLEVGDPGDPQMPAVRQMLAEPAPP